MTNFSLKTKFTDGGEVYLLSTVRLQYFCNCAPYETMLFKINKRNRVSYKDLYCQQYHTQQEAEKIYSCVLSEEKGFGKQYDLQA
jgi:hypothetical protein